MDYALTLKDHVLFPLAVFFVIVAILMLGVGLICGWFHKCSKCGSRFTIIGAYEGGVEEGTEIRAIRDCFSCGHQESMSILKYPHHPGP